jgi:hypothetical protein
MKRVILVTQKDTNATQVYSSIRKFVEQNKSYNEQQIYYCVSRKKRAFEDDIIIVHRVDVL